MFSSLSVIRVVIRPAKIFYDLFKRFINTDLLQYQYFDNEILKICFMANLLVCSISVFFLFFLDFTILHTISQTIFSKSLLLCDSHRLLKDLV